MFLMQTERFSERNNTGSQYFSPDNLVKLYTTEKIECALYRFFNKGKILFTLSKVSLYSFCIFES